MLHSMPLLVQNHGKMCTRCKTDVVVLVCKFKILNQCHLKWVIVVSFVGMYVQIDVDAYVYMFPGG